MKSVAVAFIVGAIVGVPLTAWLGPIGTFIAIFLVSFIISASTTDSPKRPKPRSKNKATAKDDAELVSIILPTIRNDK